MTKEQAGEVVTILNAGFPREALEPATVELWVTELALLQDPQIAIETGLTIVRNGDRFPSLKDFRLTYRSVADRHRANIPALPEPDRSTAMPEWVEVYWWARLSRDDDRIFPQQEHLAGTCMTRDEYEQLVGEWRAAGAPGVRTVRDMVKALAA